MREVAVACALVAAVGCRRTDIVGNIGCATSADCTPPDTICSTDGRCVLGCTKDPDLCVGGSTCNSATGECSGLGGSCHADGDCDPPDLVCHVANGACQPGCTVSPAVCASDEICNAKTGHCCKPGVAGCPSPSPPPRTCNGDSDCSDPPRNICSGGVCAPGCASGALCTQPLACNPATGHCEPMSATCARDTDCDAGSYCTQAGACVVLAYGGATPCQGGTNVSYTCATKTTPAAFASCVGAPGPGGCPYCIDGSCLHPGLCVGDPDCHAGDRCRGGLCRVVPSECPTLLNLVDVANGVYAAGKEVCVRGVVTSTRSGYDGMVEIRLGSSPYLYVDLEPMYGLAPPQLNQTITVHGTVRWDDGHKDRELLPVDFIGM